MSEESRDGSFLKAFEDLDFLKRDELRPVRLMLELQKPEMQQREAGIRSTIVVFGSARILEPSVAKGKLDEARRLRAQEPGPARERDVRVAERMVESSVYYDMARRFGAIVSSASQIDGRCDYVIATGGGPGIMEAANRGAADVGAKSIGFNIELPREQRPNDYIARGLGFNFHYFAIRKMHFMLRAKALVVFPGGYGTIDELFEALTLVQTGKVVHLPVVLVGRAFWEKTFNLPHLLEEGMIEPEDLRLYRYAETAEEAWRHILEYYEARGTA
ncbi:MAG TPA: LOG family protein [Candidatus Polarisedimenticolaceae bacterium]|nr:LOG family protein [Candidatus Polarisedimenticolaceae bacterium]